MDVCAYVRVCVRLYVCVAQGVYASIRTGRSLLPCRQVSFAM
jgi:hypothetical protein